MHMRMVLVLWSNEIIQIRYPLVGTFQNITPSFNTILLKDSPSLGQEFPQRTDFIFPTGEGSVPAKPLRRQSESQQFRNLSSVLVGLCHFVDAVHTLTHPRSTPVLCFTGITTVRQVKWLLAIFTGPFRYSVSSGVVRLVRYPFHTPGSERSYIRSYERRNLVRNKRTILAHIFPPCFIYHRLQNYNSGFLYPKQKGHSGLIGRARYV